MVLNSSRGKLFLVVIVALAACPALAKSRLYCAGQTDCHKEKQEQEQQIDDSGNSKVVISDGSEHNSSSSGNEQDVESDSSSSSSDEGTRDDQGSAADRHPHDPLPPLTPDQAVEPNVCLPGFVVIGAQKGGTSSVYHYIRMGVHPNLWVPMHVKEQDFFNRHIERGRTFLDYLRAFPFVDDDSSGGDPLEGQCEASRAVERGEPRVVMGEASPNYMPTWAVPKRVKQHLPNARLVVLLKHPALRAISAYNMRWQVTTCAKDKVWERDCFTSLDVPHQQLVADYLAGMRAMVQSQVGEMTRCYDKQHYDVEPVDTLAACWGVEQLKTAEIERLVEDNSTLWRGIYADQLARWLRHFSPGQFLLWASEDFEVRPAEHMAQLAEWVGLDPSQIDSEATSFKHHKRQKLVGVPADVRSALLDFFRPHNARLYSLLRDNGFSALAARLEAYWDKWPAADGPPPQEEEQLQPENEEEGQKQQEEQLQIEKIEKEEQQEGQEQVEEGKQQQEEQLRIEKEEQVEEGKQQQEDMQQ